MSTHYTELYVVFSRKPRLPNSNEEWLSFKEDNAYAIISDKPKIEKKFRFCQIALWGGFIDKLKDPFCNLPDLQEVLKLLPEDLLSGGLLSSPLKSILPTGNLPTNKITQQVGETLTGGNQLPLGTSNLGNTLLGGGKQMKTTSAPGKRQTTTGRSPVGNLNVGLPSILG